MAEKAEKKAAKKEEAANEPKAEKKAKRAEKEKAAAEKEADAQNQAHAHDAKKAHAPKEAHAHGAGEAKHGLETKHSHIAKPAEEPDMQAGVEERREAKRQPADENELKQTVLVETEKYLNTGSHIGTKFKSGDMRRYIYKMRKDGLNVLDVQVVDERLKFAAKLLAKFPGDKIAVVSRKSYGQTPTKAFAEAVGGMALTGRFVPGTFTNPQCTRFVEPKIVVITDPEYDVQAIEEATVVRIPVVAMASTNNALKNIDLCVPMNNKGRKSLALAYWILSKEILKERGDIKSESEFAKTPEDFEYKMKEGEEEEQRRNFEKREKGKRFGGKGRFGDRDKEGRGGSRFERMVRTY